MNQIIDLTIKNIKNIGGNYELSVVIPVYNESANLQKVLGDWHMEFSKLKINYCFVIVNDGSKDNSLEVLKILNHNIVILDKHNSGHGRSIRLGYDFSLYNIKSEFILQIDSDGQCDPKYFKDFWKNREKYDFILGVRKTRGDGIIRKLTSKISLIVTSIITSINLKDPNTPYRLFNRKSLKQSLSHINESFDIHNIAVTYVILKNRLKFKTIEITFPNRLGGENSINFLKVFQMGLNMVFDLYFLSKKLK